MPNKSREILVQREKTMRARGELCAFAVHQAGACLCIREVGHEGDHSCFHGCKTPYNNKVNFADALRQKEPLAWKFLRQTLRIFDAFADYRRACVVCQLAFVDGQQVYFSSYAHPNGKATLEAVHHRGCDFDPASVPVAAPKAPAKLGREEFARAWFRGFNFARGLHPDAAPREMQAEAAKAFDEFMEAEAKRG